ncbi:hypothetical protein TKK_0019026 [Trichogramma kaykai]
MFMMTWLSDFVVGSSPFNMSHHHHHHHHHHHPPHHHPFMLPPSCNNNSGGSGYDSSSLNGSPQQLQSPNSSVGSAGGK